MKKLLLIFFLLIGSLSYGQTVFTQTFVDRCTGEVKVVTANFVNGSATVAFYNKVRVFTYQEFTSGVLHSWLMETYAWWNALSPCSTTQTQATTAQQQATQAQQQATQAQNAATNATSNATNAASTATNATNTTATTGTTQTTTTGTSGGTTTTNTGSTNTGSTNTSSSNTSTGGTTNDNTTNTNNTSNDSGTTNTGTENSSGGTETGSTDSSSSSDSSSNNSSDNSSEGSSGSSSEGSEGGDVDNSSGDGGGESSDNSEGSSDSSEGSGEGEGSGEESSEETKTEESSEEKKEESTEETKEEEKKEESSEEKEEESKEEESSEEESEESDEESEESEEESEEEESEEESDEESTEEESEEEEEKEKKFMPIQLKADMMQMQTPLGIYNTVLNIGASRSSIYGDVAYTANMMVWDNLQQVSFMGARSKVKIVTPDYSSIKHENHKHYGKGKEVNSNDPQTPPQPYVAYVSATSVGYSNNYGYSTMMLSQSLMKPFKSGLTVGVGLSAGTTFVSYPIKEGVMLSYNALATKSFQLGSRITYSPALIWTQTPFMSGESGVNFKWENPMGLQMKNMLKGTEIDGMGILANSFTVQLTNRFSFNVGWTVIKSTNPIVPIINSFMIGSKLPF